MINTPPFISFKYTSGNEYILQKNKKNYQGYYFEFGDEIYAGEKFILNTSNKLIKVSDNIDNPLDLYGNIPGTQIPQSQTISSFPFNPTDEDFDRGFIMRYFIKKISKNNVIVETNKATFKEIQSNSLYQTLEVNYSFDVDDKKLDELDKQMPGLKEFIIATDIRTSSNEDNPFTVFF